MINDWQSFRNFARHLLHQNTRPEDVLWFADRPPTSDAPLTVPRRFAEIGQIVAMHRDEDRWALLYRVLYRIKHGEPRLLEFEIDDDVRRLALMVKAIRRDMHKMTAFVRFRRTADDHYIAWYKPDHYIVEAVAPFFVKRFGSMRWSILTPDGSAHWDLEKLTFGPGVPRSEAPSGDALEDLWRDYYASIFNPARVNLKAMSAEMPQRFWSNLPEAQTLPTLLANAADRVASMAATQKASATPFLPPVLNLPNLRHAAPECRGCDLYERATQVVFGEGPANAKVVMVGEQPGDEEDRNGHPFIGPAGRLLDKAMQEAGLDRNQIYVTNAVKHFKWIERGKRRIHAKPSGIEVSACKPWLEAEIAVVKPELIVCLGATAAQSLMGREFRITSGRGRFFPHRWAPEIVATIHPSAILRMPERHDEEFELFVRDLALVQARLHSLNQH